MPALLKSFAIVRSDDAYIVRIATQDGGEQQISATFEQLDLLAEEIDRQLDDDENGAIAAGPFASDNDPD